MDKMIRTEPAVRKWFYKDHAGKDTRAQITSFDEFICAVPVHANAKHIVKCVNSHDELVAVCKEALKDLKSTRESGDCGNYEKQPLEYKLEDIIAKAEA